MTTLTIRPQPLGIVALPAGYLVIPPADGAAALSAALLRGQVPAEPPAALRFYTLALAGEISAALDALAGDQSPEASYNRFVLQSEPAEYQRLRGELRGELASLLDLVAYTLGWIAQPPELGGATGELAAIMLAARATAAIEREQPELAIAALDAAVAAARPESPLLAAQLLGDLADISAQSGAGLRATQQLREALALLEGLPADELRAQLALRLGMAYQDLADSRRGPLLEAVRCYQQALQVYTREAHPELFALAQNNLALAYLAMPLVEASDQLRMAIAVQALREALKVYTRADYPERWVSAQLNLANALQYLPSANVADHLAEAVELYEELLTARDPADDPHGYARLLANQGNALAHLGIFDHARAKLGEATALFTAHGDAAAAGSVADLLDTIAERELAAQVGHGSVSAPAV